MTLTGNTLGPAVEAAIAKSKEKAEVLELNFESLTFGELCDIEDAVGAESASTLLGGKPSPKAVTAAIWIVKRRSDPGVTFDAVKALNILSVTVA